MPAQNHESVFYFCGCRTGQGVIHNIRTIDIHRFWSPARCTLVYFLELPLPSVVLLSPTPRFLNQLFISLFAKPAKVNTYMRKIYLYLLGCFASN